LQDSWLFAINLEIFNALKVELVGVMFVIEPVVIKGLAHLWLKTDSRLVSLPFILKILSVAI
jgi:hypothetical protein